MKKFLVFLTALTLLLAFNSCSKSEKSKPVVLESYNWGLDYQETHSTPVTGQNVLYEETAAELDQFKKAYSKKGSFESDEAALKQAKYEEGLKAFQELVAKINERIKTFDNDGETFTINATYYIHKGSDGKQVKADVNVILELKKDYSARSIYEKNVDVPLSDELKKGDPATYTAVIPLDECMDFFYIKVLEYDGQVKVYDASTKLMNPELTFISGVSTSVKDKTMTLTFTGTSQKISAMKGNWYANVYVKANGALDQSKLYTVIVSIPFTVK